MRRTSIKQLNVAACDHFEPGLFEKCKNCGKMKKAHVIEQQRRTSHNESDDVDTGVTNPMKDASRDNFQNSSQNDGRGVLRKKVTSVNTV
jgi:hypothetical protein